MCTRFYSYDIHGNVKSLLQDNNNPDVVALGQRYKRMDYTYDLISGNVHEVKYQAGEPDQWFHRYTYDADNRIKTVQTSNSLLSPFGGAGGGFDAKYFYYAHGPLARVELGNDKVQGMDYAYTLQGWIKGVNSETLNEKRDIGKDGETTSVNKLFARDALGYSLGYFTDDYSAIDTNKNLTANNFLADKIDPNTQIISDLLNARNNLFNGNISAMVTTIVPPTLIPAIPPSGGGGASYSPLPQGTAYKYDQLNRLKEMQAYQNIDAVNNTWQSGGGYNFMYSNSFEYDANGNITKQKRFSALGQGINDLTYQRLKSGTGQLLQNRLYHVNDNVPDNDFTDDIDDQGTFDNTPQNVNTDNNYGYDEIGNLIRNNQKEIMLMTYTVYGKVRMVMRTPGSTKKSLLYDYDASGNRIAKHIYDSYGNWEKTHYYVRDAQGNVMSIYRNKVENNLMSYAQTEKHIYGSSRVGIEKTKTEMIGAPSVSTNNFSHTLGNKFYEGTNHLGNVISIFTDRKFPISLDGITVDYFIPDVTGANDYYPFGVKMKERSFNSSNYRQGFNGKEFDSETETVNQGDRDEDPDLGIFLSIDHLAKGFPYYSPYQFAGNKVIVAIDMGGKEEFVVVTGFAGALYGVAFIHVSKSYYINKANDDYNKAKSGIDDAINLYLTAKMNKSKKEIKSAIKSLQQQETELDLNHQKRLEKINTDYSKTKYAQYNEMVGDNNEAYITKQGELKDQMGPRELDFFNGGGEIISKLGKTSNWNDFIKEPDKGSFQDYWADNTYVAPTNFEPNSYELNQNDIAKLDLVYAVMGKFSETKIAIIGYTDKDGDANSNQNLSEARTKSAAQYLISKGIDPGRITTKGMGESQAKQDNPSDKEKAKDRKIEFKFTSK